MESQVISENKTTAEFNEARKGKIGSSDIAAILGLNKYRSPLQVYCEMTGTAEPTQENEAMRWGHQLAPSIANMWSSEHGYPITLCERTFGLSDDLFSWAIATPDYICFPDSTSEEQGEPAILEIKNTSSYSKGDWDDGAVPDHAHCQTIWQMGITGIHRAFIACLIGGNELVTRQVIWDENLFITIMGAVKEFHDRVLRLDPPPAKAQDEELIMTLWGFEEDKIIANDELAAPLHAYQIQKEQYDDYLKKAKASKYILEQIEFEIRSKMGSASVLKAGTKYAIVKRIERNGYEVKPSSYYTFKVKDE